jgi:hypothetical protein
MRAKRNRCVSVERIVNASPEAVFAVLSNPRQHSSIDGSRTLLGRDCENSLQTTPLRLDSTFHTAMRRWPASLHMTDLVQAASRRRDGAACATQSLSSLKIGESHGRTSPITSGDTNCNR